MMAFPKKKFWLVYLMACMLGVIWIAAAGCSQPDKEVASVTLRTAEEAKIAVLESDNCESCHLDAEMIASFEKPKSDVPVVSEGG